MIDGIRGMPLEAPVLNISVNRSATHDDDPGYLEYLRKYQQGEAGVIEET